MSLHSQLNESETQYNLIDPLLEKAGWNLADRRSVGFEIPVNGYDTSPVNGITDYCLYRDNGEVLAVVEAKRTKRAARVGKEQLLQYITKIEAKQSFKPYGFLCNGDDIWFWDSVNYPERPVAGFFKKEDLERLLFLQQNCQPLSTVAIKESIVNRSYQVEAIRRISEHIESRHKRKALLVMAIGTGKTRTAIALIDLFHDEEGPQKIPVLVGIFNTRLAKAELLLGDQNSEDFKRVITDIRADIAKLPLDSFTVKQHLKDIRETFENDWWLLVTVSKIELLRMKLAPLLRFAATGNLAEAFFVSKMERLGLSILQEKDISTAAKNIQEEVDLLPRNLPQVAPHVGLINDMIGSNWWQEPTVAKLDHARKVLAPLMKYKREQAPLVIELGLDDVIESRKWVIVNKGGQKLMVDEYRKKVEERIQQLSAAHPTIQKLLHKEAVTIDDLIELERTLETELLNDELTLTEDNMLKAFGVRVGALTDFLKYILKLEHLPDFADVVRKAFDAFILEHKYNADQTRFLRTVQTVFVQKRRLEVGDLYEAPFANFGLNAVEKLFSEVEVEEILDLTKRLIA